MTRQLKLSLFLLLALGVALVLLLKLSQGSVPKRMAPVAVVAPAAPVVTAPGTDVAAPEVSAPVVPRPDALHVYAVDAVLTLTPAYAERGKEPKEMREARWTMLASECADAVEESGLTEDQEKWSLALLWIAHRETILARDPCHIGIGDCDQGLAGDSPWQIHADVDESLKGWDRMRCKTALALLRKQPDAWGLPHGKPWLGLVADRGKHGVNRPSVMEYVRAHPYTP
jgi:hypothetical protein